MESDWQAGLVGGGLIPVVARAVELGRGPPDLVRWVRDRFAALGGEAGTDHGRPVLRRVANELARLLPRAGSADTLRAGVGMTLTDLTASERR